MLFKLLTVVLVVLLAAETAFLLMHRQSANRFKPVEGYDEFVALDTATGQLCKTLRTRSAAEFAAEFARVQADAAKKPVPCPLLPAPSGDPVLDEINRSGISKRCGGNGEDVAQKSDANSALEFVASLPACKDIR